MDLTAIAETVVASPLIYMGWRLWHKMYTEYDRSMLVCLGTDAKCKDYARCYVILGPMPYINIGSRVESNLDMRNVVGYVVGEPKWVSSPCLLPGRSGRPRKECIDARGYYAHVIIHWERWLEVRQFTRGGYHVRKTEYSGCLPTQRENRFLGFGTESEPDSVSGLPAYIEDVADGWRAPFRYQPYLKGGFKAHDLERRQLSPCARIAIRLEQVYRALRRRTN